MIADRKEELLVILQEEASEVVQAVSKAFRFGETERNIRDLETEIGDFLGVLRCLVEEGYIDQTGESLMRHAEAKIKKLEKHMTHQKAS
jgi:NTP pyrophosphatase (non-canonical NTP hydrolase)